MGRCLLGLANYATATRDVIRNTVDAMASHLHLNVPGLGYNNTTCQSGGWRDCIN